MIKEPKYRLVCIKRSFFINPLEIDKVSRVPDSAHFMVSFKNSTTKSLHIHRKVFKRLLKDFPTIKVI